MEPETRHVEPRCGIIGLAVLLGWILVVAPHLEDEFALGGPALSSPRPPGVLELAGQPSPTKPGASPKSPAPDPLDGIRRDVEKAKERIQQLEKQRKELESRLERIEQSTPAVPNQPPVMPRNWLGWVSVIIVLVASFILVGLAAWYVRTVIEPEISSLREKQRVLSEDLTKVVGHAQTIHHEERELFRVRSPASTVERTAPVTLERKDLMNFVEPLTTALNNIYNVLNAIRGEIVSPRERDDVRQETQTAARQIMIDVRERQQQQLVENFIRDFNAAYARVGDRPRFRATYNSRKLALQSAAIAGGAAPGPGDHVRKYVESNYGKIEVCKVGESWLVVPAFEESTSEPTIREAFSMRPPDEVRADTSPQPLGILVRPAVARLVSSDLWELESQGLLAVNTTHR